MERAEKEEMKLGNNGRTFQGDSSCVVNIQPSSLRGRCMACLSKAPVRQLMTTIHTITVHGMYTSFSRTHGRPNVLRTGVGNLLS